MATIVTKLFALAGPCRAYFGEKDYQQLAVIRRLVADLSLPVEVVGCPTVRDSDGLALSSRNAYLTPEERAVAPALYRALLGRPPAVEERRRDRPRRRAPGHGRGRRRRAPLHPRLRRTWSPPATWSGRTRSPARSAC